MNKTSHQTTGYRPIVPAPPQQPIIITTPTTTMTSNSRLAPISPHQSPQSNPITQNYQQQHQQHYQQQYHPQHNQYQYQQPPPPLSLQQQSPSHHPHQYNQQQQQYYRHQQTTPPQNPHQHGGVTGGVTLPPFETPPVSPFSLPMHNNDHSSNQINFKLPPPILSQLGNNNNIGSSSASKNFTIINMNQSRFNPILPKQSPALQPSSQQPTTSVFSLPVTPTTNNTSTNSNQNLINNSPIMQSDQREMARKASHSQIERRRRERINDKIMQLRELIPGCSEQENMHKLSVLQNAIEYIESIKKSKFNRYEIPIPKSFLSAGNTTTATTNSNVISSSTINSYEDCEEYKHKRINKGVEDASLKEQQVEGEEDKEKVKGGVKDEEKKGGYDLDGQKLEKKKDQDDQEDDQDGLENNQEDSLSSTNVRRGGMTVQHLLC
nr:1565_t:CDS:2 [Entrophospora candida]